MLKILLRNVDYASLPHRSLRFSAIDEALESLGSIMAVNNLPHYGILQEDAFKVEDKATYNDRMSALLLIALRILPKLPYYLAVDTWRLEELEFPSLNITQSWWNTRYV